ncbi:MAG: M20/M25/M40 family metallo-hydrolase, partial [Tissierellia bacterium]|nr:M20/M25/M40 family metallo-hydrolase [Tissierellia bacterium]
MDYALIKQTAENYRDDMSAFLRDLIAIPGESAQEAGVIERIVKEMEQVGFDDIQVDPQGNVLGYVGTGEKIIAFDAHIDTVGIGEITNWTFDPYEGYETDEEIGGRGASDQLGGIVSSVYGAKIMKQLGLIPEG